MTRDSCCCNDGLRQLEWGSHLCHLYHSHEDLIAAAVPFFAAGLDRNEQCLWVTAGPVECDAAKRALAERVLNLQQKIEGGQIRILDHSEWYSRSGKIDAELMLGACLAAEENARASGYAGLRGLGDVSFLKTRDEWLEFQRYESRLSEAFAGRRIIGLCSYDLTDLPGGDMLELMSHHHCTVVRGEDEWRVFDGNATTPVPYAGPQLNELLETRVRERTADLQRALHEHIRAARAKDEFLGILGHELRGPLAPMMTALQLMQLRGMESREQEILVRQVTHLTRLVDDLLDMTRIAQGKLELRKRPIELSQIIIRAIELAAPLVDQRQQRLEIQVPREGLLVNADLERMAQVVGNLLTNASKYSDPGSRIRIAGARERSKIRCCVKDEGIGISAEMLRGIFKPFVQQRETLDHARGGLGLGLAIVTSLVQEHGGAVHAVSEGLRQGSEFIVELPALGEGYQGQAPVTAGTHLSDRP